MNLPNFDKVLFRIGAKEVTVPQGDDTFVLDPSGQGKGTEIWLTLEQPWTSKGGVEPDVNSAKVPWTQFDKIGGNPVQVTGDIEFWFGSGTTTPQATPDVTLKNITLVHVEATAFGMISKDGQRRITEYRLFFADMRHWWIPPRGGHLNVQGIINGPETVNYQSNSFLLTFLLKKLGVLSTDIVVDAGVDTLPSLRNLEWRGAHPQEELKKCLETLGLVLAPQSDGKTIKIFPTGVGPSVSVPVARDLGVIKLPGIDRRGKTVVFSSAPHAVIKTAEIQGPNAATLEFVAEDKWSTGLLGWRKLENITGVGSDAIAALKAGFAGVDTLQRGRVLDQAFRFVRVVPSQRIELFRTLLEKADLRGTPIVVRAKCATLQSDGTWKNATDYVDFAAVSLHRELAEVADYMDTKGNPLPAYVIGVKDRLVKVSSDGVSDRDGNAVALGTGDLHVRFSYEKIGVDASEVPLEDENGKAQTIFFRTGYMLDDGGAPLKLTDDQLANALLDKNTLTVRDERIMVEGGVGGSNMLTLEQDRAALAKRWLRGSGNPPQKRSVIGFFNMELSGIVAQIQWTQGEPRTDFDLNTWHLPTGLWSLGKMQAERKALAEKFPGQAATAQTRAAMGGASASQPSVLLTPSAPPAGGTPENGVLVRVAGQRAGSEVYVGHIVKPAASTPAIDPAAAAAGAAVTGGDGELVTVVNASRLGKTGWIIPSSVSIVMVGRITGAVTTDTPPQRVVAINERLPWPGTDLQVLLAQSAEWTASYPKLKSL